MLIDCDAHLSTPDCFDAVKDKSFAQQYRDHFSKTGNLKDAATQIKEAKSLGVTHQLINFFGTNSGLNYHLPSNQAVDRMKVYNNSASKICQESDGFFSANGWVAMQDPKASLKELERIKQLGLFAVAIDDTISWGRIGYFKLFLEKCNELMLPVYIHFTKFYHYIDNQLPDINDHDILDSINDASWNFQCAVENNNHFLKMLYSLMEQEWFYKLKNIKIIIAERGIDWIPQFVSFFKKHQKKDILPTLQKHFWFTTEPEQRGFVKDAQYIGWDRLLFASDHGHDADCGGANFGKDYQTFLQYDIKDSDLKKIFYENFQKIIQK